MRSKTKKLIWLAPIAAVIAAIGALAIFAVQPADPASAHGVPGPVTGLEATRGTTAISYTEIKLTWNKPTTGGAPTHYRIDVAPANNPHVWEALVAATPDDDTEYTIMGLEAGDSFRYRVFGVNTSGTGAASIQPSSAVGSTKTATTPGAVLNLTATKGSTEKLINLSWTPPTDDGGSEIKRYCIIADDEAIVSQTVSAACTGANTTTPNVADGSEGAQYTIVVAGDVTSYAFKGPVVTPGTDITNPLKANTRYYFQAYAVNQGASALQIGSPASNVPNAWTATAGTGGSTDGEKAPTELIVVKEDGSNVDLFWNWPEGYEGQSFYVQHADNDSFTSPTNATVDASPTGTTPQSDSVDISGDSGKRYFRVRAGGATDTANDWSKIASISLPLSGIATGDQPVFAAEAVTAATSSDLPFERINVTWVSTPATDSGTPVPTGYRISYRENATGEPWMMLENDTTYACCSYNHIDLKAGDNFEYRVFPYYAASGDKGDIYGAPLAATASTAAAAAPGPVRGLTVTADGPTALKLSWPAVTDNGGAEITGYRVERVSNDTNNDTTLVSSPTWVAIDLIDSETNGVVATVDADTLTYTYIGDLNNDGDTTDSEDDPLSRNNVRWFRVFAINSVNDDKGTGDDGPTGAETRAAEERYGKTTGGTPPAAPEDLTAETARDSNGKLRTDRGVLLLWNSPEEPKSLPVTGYVIQWKANDGDWTKLIDLSNRNYTYHTHGSEPKADETRMYRVAAKNVAGTSGWSNEAEYPPTDNHMAPTAPTLDAVRLMLDSDPAMVDAKFTGDDLGGALAYSIAPAMTDVATATVDAKTGMVTITPVAYGTATFTVTATDNLSGTAMSSTVDIMVTVYSNPTADAPILAQSLKDAGDMSTATVDLDDHFSDADGDTLTYTAASSAEAIATVSEPDADGMITVTGVSVGEATITVTAMDDDGAEALTATFDVTVTSANAAPVAGDAIDDVPSVRESEKATRQANITDPDGDTLTWAAKSSDPDVATVEVDSAGMVTVTGVKADDDAVTITVTATDEDGSGKSESQTFMVTVTAGALTKPTNVAATVDGSDVTVTWTDGDFADVHHVYLISSDFEVAGTDRVPGAPSPMTATLSNVDAGVYFAVVQATSPAYPDDYKKYSFVLVTVPTTP